MANGYEIRQTLLMQANHILMEAWKSECEVARFNASLSSTKVENIAPPTAAQIKALAEELYEFVQRK